MSTVTDFPVHEIYLAGERVPPGTYRDVDTGREIQLEDESSLPASFDGRVAAYMCIRNAWREHGTRALPQAETAAPRWRRTG